MSAQAILTLSCPDRPGIVAAVSTFLFRQSCSIIDAQQFGDLATNVFFMRVVFEVGGDGSTITSVTDGFAEIGKEFESRGGCFLTGFMWVVHRRRGFNAECAETQRESVCVNFHLLPWLLLRVLSVLRV